MNQRLRGDPPRGEHAPAGGPVRRAFRGVLRWLGVHAWEAALLVAAAGVITGYVVGGLVVDPDLWGHVAFGKALLSSGLPAGDPYSYTSGPRVWINHELGAEIVFGWLHDAFGPAGLQLFRYVLVASVVGWVWREQIRAGQRASGAGLVTALLVLAMGPGFATIRPRLFTHLFFLLLLLCLVRGDREGSRWPWAAPLLVALWVNFHGGVLAGVGVLGLWWAGKAAASALRRDRSGVPAGRAGIVLLLSLSALVVNPYGPELPVFLAETATVPRPAIIEWASIAASPVGLTLWVVLTAGGAWLLGRASAERIRLEHVAILAALSLLPLLARRHLTLYALGWGVLLAPYVPDLAGRLYKSRFERLRSGRRPPAVEAVLVAACLVVGAGGFAVAGGFGSFPCIPLPSAKSGVGSYPQRALRVLRRSDITGNLATPFNWGEYVIWETAPYVRVGMDGRRETVYPDSVYRAYLRYRAGEEDWDAWLDDYGADMALVRAGSPPDNLLSLEPRWREAHRDDVAALHGRRGWSGTRRVAAASADREAFEPIRCFPDDGPSWREGDQRPVASPSTSPD